MAQTSQAMASSPPEHTSSQLQVLITPSSDRTTYLLGNEIQGEVYIKGLQENGRQETWLDILFIRLSIKDRLPGQPSITLQQTSWIPLFVSSGSRSAYSKHQEAYGPSHHFVIPLPSTLKLPGCVHFLDSNGGEVTYELNVKMQLSGGSKGTREIRENHAIHVTPVHVDNAQLAQTQDDGPSVSRPSTGPSNDIDPPPQETQETKTITKGKSEGKARLLISKDRVRANAALPVGVELWQLNEGPEGVRALQGLRRVKLEWWRRIRIPTVEQETASVSGEAGSSKAPLVPPEPSSSQALSDHVTLLHKSGKSCRHSPTRPVRLLFELPALTKIAQKREYGVCGELSQDTPYHAVSFFVRVIIGFSGREEGDVVLEKTIIVDRPSWQEDPIPPINHDPTALELQDIAQDDLSDLPEDPELRRQAYRLKGQDRVGELGTFRMASSTIGEGPSGTSGLIDSVDDGAPPSFSEVEAGVGPVLDVEGQSEGELPTFAESQSHIQAQPGSLPTHGRNQTDPIAVSTVPSPLLRPRTPPTQIVGELATWVEYDGYETFSQPPPTAAVSLGSSSTMDMPQGDEEPDPNGGGLGGSGLGLGGVQDLNSGRMEDRVRLMEQLGLGEGTRVFDIQGDMPPGIDEPSLPGLPHAVLSHHGNRHRQHSIPTSSLPRGSMDGGLSAPPPAFTASALDPHHPGESIQESTSTSEDRPPPPSFAASEAADRRGLAAAGPNPPGMPLNAQLNGGLGSVHENVGLEEEGTGRTPDLPPMYEGHGNGVDEVGTSRLDAVRNQVVREDEDEPADAPPGYT